MVEVSAFRWVPPFARGVVRDLRVRWALEELGRPYQVRLVSFEDAASEMASGRQPFGQVPAYRDGELRLFETGAIVLHLADKDERLLPKAAGPRARATAWMFAALNSVEPFVMTLAEIDFFAAHEEWAKWRRPGAEAMVKQRLTSVAEALGNKEYLEGEFSAGDLLMLSVLRILRHTTLVDEHENLKAYLARGEARPAFQRALAAQLADFQAEPPASAS